MQLVSPKYYLYILLCIPPRYILLDPGILYDCYKKLEYLIYCNKQCSFNKNRPNSIPTILFATCRILGRCPRLIVLTIHKPKFIYRVSQYTWKLSDDFYVVFVPRGVITWTQLLFQLKQLVLGILKCLFTIFALVRLTELLRNLSRFELIKWKQTLSNIWYLR